MKPRRPVITIIRSIGVVIVVLVVAAVIYLNALYNLLDRTEITGNPTIEESDLADPEDLAPMTSDPRATGGTTASFSEPSNGPDPDETSNGPGET